MLEHIVQLHCHWRGELERTYPNYVYLLAYSLIQHLQYSDPVKHKIN